MPNRALIISYPQVAFCTPRGSLAVPNANLIIPVITKLKLLRHAVPDGEGTPQRFYDVVIITGDPRPCEDTESSKAVDGQQEIFDQNAFHPELKILASDVIRSGDCESYSRGLCVFDEPAAKNQGNGGPYLKHEKTEVHQILLDNKVLEVDIVGVALETNIKWTAEIASRLGYHTRIITDAVASIDHSKIVGVLAELRERWGVYAAASSQIVRESQAWKVPVEDLAYRPRGPRDVTCKNCWKPSILTG